MIRWKYLLPRMAVLLFLVLLANVFTKPLVRWILVQSAQSVTGARVDIGEVEASFGEGRLRLVNIQVADPARPMTNIMQADEAVFQLDPGKLLNRQWVVENAALKASEAFLRLFEQIGFSPYLKDYGIKKNEVTGLAQKAYRVGQRLIHMNIREFSEEQTIRLFNKAFGES